MAQNPNTEKDSVTGVETTGHEWDGLKELNNPAPRWWLWVFLVTIVWAVGYWVVYPAWPTPGGATKGAMKWTQHAQLAAGQADIAQKRARYEGQFRDASLEAIEKDAALYEFGRAGGAVVFKENCAACHGTGAAGGKGYPNLNDDDWLWGGTLSQIHQTIRVGVNSGHAEQRGTQMPAFGRDGILNRAQIDDVVAYVADLHRGDKAPVTPARTRGEKIFAENCASCHGARGEGNTEMGAPRLNDEVWLWGGDTATITATVTNARTGVMPAWEARLSPVMVKSLAVYVHALGGGLGKDAAR